MIIGLFIFLGTNLSSQETVVDTFKFLNPIDTTYTLEYWDMVQMEKYYGYAISYEREILEFYKKDSTYNETREKVILQDSIIEQKDQLIRYIDSRNRVLIGLYQECLSIKGDCDDLRNEHNKEINSLKKIILDKETETKHQNNLKNGWKIFTGGVTLASILLRVFNVI